MFCTHINSTPKQATAIIIFTPILEDTNRETEDRERQRNRHRQTEKGNGREGGKGEREGKVDREIER